MEAKRVLGSKTFLAVLMTLTLLTIFFMSSGRSTGFRALQDFGETYHAQLESMSSLSWQEAEKHCEALRQDTLDDSSGNTQESLNQYFSAGLLKDQYVYLQSYEGYLNHIQTQAQNMQAVSFFSDPDSFGYRNTIKTASDFRAMEGKTVTPGHDLAVTGFFADRWTDYSIMILMCVVCGLFTGEMRDGLWPMIHASSGGRKKLAMKRVGILFAAAWIGTLVIAGSKILFCSWLYRGFSEWDRMIQSVSMFQDVPYPMTIGQFWQFYLTVKALGAFLIGLILWAILSGISNLGLALCAAGLLIGGEYAYTWIPSVSFFAIFRYLNIFSYIDYLSIFTRYLNLNLFGFPVTGSLLVLWLLPLLCGLAIWGNLRIAEKKYPVAPLNPLLKYQEKLQKRLDSHLSGGPLLVQETKKLLLKRKGILLICAFSVFLMQSSAPPKAYNPLDMYLHYYEVKYTGPITEQKITDLRAEAETAEISEQKSAAEALAVTCENAPEGAWLLPFGPYDAIWNDNLGNYQNRTGLMVLLFLVLILAPIVSQEKQANMDLVLASAPGGRKRLWGRKQLLTVSITVLIWAMALGTELSKTVGFYGDFQGLNAPVQSIPAFQELPVPMTLWQTLLGYYLRKLCVLLSAAEICFLLSGMCRRNRDAVLVCAGTLLIPAGLASIGSKVAGAVSVLPAMTVPFENYPGLAVVMILGILSWLLSRKIHRFPAIASKP